MVERLILLPEAVADASESYAWYESQEPGLGDEFLRCLEACIVRIQRSPRLYPVAVETYRRALLRRFPYAIFYEYDDRGVVIFAVFHCSQDPQKWRARTRR